MVMVKKKVSYQFMVCDGTQIPVSYMKVKRVTHTSTTPTTRIST